MSRIVQRRLALASDIQHDPESPINFTALATQTEGYSATDLQDFVARAVHQAAIRSRENGVVSSSFYFFHTWLTFCVPPDDIERSGF